MIQTRIVPRGTTPSEMVLIPANSCADGRSRVAIRLQQAVPFDANEFRLGPQDSAQQARRDEAIAERERQSRVFAQIESQVHILTIFDNAQTNLNLAYGNGTHPVTALTVRETASLSNFLCATDSAGVLRQWALSEHTGSMEPCSSPIAFVSVDGYTLVPVCLESLSNGDGGCLLGGIRDNHWFCCRSWDSYCSTSACTKHCNC